MIKPDKECDFLVNLFLKKNIKKKFPIFMKSTNPVFRRKGTSFDFKNIREYGPFDDVRKVDWKLFGRTERFYIKEYFEEEELPVFIAIDTSASLGIFSESDYKTTIVSLCYMLLKLNFTIHLAVFSDDIESLRLNIKGARSIGTVSRTVEKLQFSGKTDIGRSLKHLADSFHPAILFLFSDFLDDSPWRSWTKSLKKGFLIHFFTPHTEIMKNLGDYDLFDRELDKSLLFPFDRVNQRVLADREKEFLDSLESGAGEGAYNYNRLTSGQIREQVYWKILERMYA